MRPAAQVVSALAMGAVLIAGFLVLQHQEDLANRPVAAASCQAAKADDSPKYPALCAALNRPDLPDLVGAPLDQVTVAGPGPSHWTNADGSKQVVDSAEVQIGQLSVRLTQDDGADVTDAEVLGSAPHQRAPVLGHLSTTYEMNTIGFTLPLGGGQSSRAPGGVAENLVIGKHPDGHGGSYEFTIWRQDTGAPDRASLYRIAEAVLPTLPDWDAASAAPSAPAPVPAVTSSPSAAS
ncbi:hypothetical protein GCM10009738_58770 [Kitasatospora viridis]|uniref:Uncharacterized protein n=2 Tax=Kitasatospora viridis TaxID=281105 RepID=A0A561T6J9_9ACTN|nr:hypothetical protein FHX73_14225 [Kitasatospora viridis]